MKHPRTPDNENERLESLFDMKILGTDTEARFDRITGMAVRIFGVPMVAISLVTKDEQWFKSCVGLGVRSTSRDISFRGHAILSDGIFTIEDALQDERFRNNPLVVGPPYIRFYSGRPIKNSAGFKIGTLCIMDTVPRTMSSDDLKNLDDLAAWVECELQRPGKK